MAFHRDDDRDLDLASLRGRAERGVRLLIRWGDRIATTWTDAHGWAPEKSATVLERGRLDRLRSLCWCLERSLDPFPDGPAAEGQLLLAWVNLGAVVEGSMRFFLTVHVDTYDHEPIERKKRGEGYRIDPHKATLDELKRYFAKFIWRKYECGGWTPDTELIELVDQVQNARNAIHQMDDRKGDLPDHDAFLQALVSVGAMADDLDTGMPDDPPVYDGSCD